MTIQFASDLHLEFPENSKFLKVHPILPKAPILILAGDIMPFIELEKHGNFLDYLSESFEMVYWLPGNHEYYYSDITERSGTFTEQIRKNVLLLNNTTIQLADHRLIFSTLWSRISTENQWKIPQMISDFKVIRHNGGTFTPAIFNRLHSDSIDFITNELEKDPTAKKILISHHVPTFQNYPPAYLGSILNEAFASDQDQIITRYRPQAWIFGHHHYNIRDLGIASTAMLTNQLGYVHHNEHHSFDSSFILALQ